MKTKELEYVLIMFWVKARINNDAGTKHDVAKKNSQTSERLPRLD